MMEIAELLETINEADFSFQPISDLCLATVDFEIF